MVPETGQITVNIGRGGANSQYIDGSGGDTVVQAGGQVQVRLTAGGGKQSNCLCGGRGWSGGLGKVFVSHGNGGHGGHDGGAGDGKEGRVWSFTSVGGRGGAVGQCCTASRASSSHSAGQENQTPKLAVAAAAAGLPGTQSQSGKIRIVGRNAGRGRGEGETIDLLVLME